MDQHQVRDLISKLDALADPARNPNAAERKVAQEKADYLRGKPAEQSDGFEEVWRGDLVDLPRDGVIEGVFSAAFSSWLVNNGWVDSADAAQSVLRKREKRRGRDKDER